MTERLTASQFRNLKKPEKTGRIPRSSKAARTVNGKTFDSLKEAKHYIVLREFERAGRIINLECQTPFALIVNGQLIGHYHADFTYMNDDGQFVVEDVKSPHTRRDPLFRWKAKHVFAQYGIRIKEVL